MTILLDPNNWEDGFSNVPPSHYELLEADGRYYMDNTSGSNNHYMTYVGTDPIPASLEVAWEVLVAPAQGNVNLEYHTGDEIWQTAASWTTVGSGTVTLTLTGAEALVIRLRSYESQTFPYEYQAIAAIGDVPETPPAEATIEYGTVINIVEKDVLDSFNASWTLASTRVPGETLNYYKCYAMDGNDPLAFWLWPRGYTGADVIITKAAIPTAVTALADTLTLSDMYVPDIVDYVAYRALQKDSRAGAKELAEKFRESFLLRLGANRQILRQIGQNTTRPPDAEA